MASVNPVDLSQYDEEWRAIPGYEELYEASTYGRIRSLARIDAAGRRRRLRIMKQTSIKKTGYLRVTLTKNRKQIVHNIHVLVCRTFHGPCPPGHCVAHWDGNNTNNCANNLRWATPKENAQDKNRHGTLLRGENQWYSRLTEKDVLEIRRLRNENIMRCCEIARHFGVSPTTIGYIVKRKSWTHI